MTGGFWQNAHALVTGAGTGIGCCDRNRVRACGRAGQYRRAQDGAAHANEGRAW